MFLKIKFDYTDSNSFKLVVCDEDFYEKTFKTGYQKDIVIYWRHCLYKNGLKKIIIMFLK